MQIEEKEITIIIREQNERMALPNYHIWDTNLEPIIKKKKKGVGCTSNHLLSNILAELMHNHSADGLEI